MSIHPPGEEGQRGRWANLPAPQAGPGVLELRKDREQGQETGQPQPPAWTRWQLRGEGLPEHLPVAPPRALQGVRAGAPAALTHLGSPLSLSFLGCKMGMKAAPSSRGGGED